MIDHRTKQLRVIDWGLADYYTPGNSYQVRVATRHYKAPELLLSYQYYSKSVDIWGVGVTFATMLFRRYPIFRGRDNAEILMKIVNVFGGEALEEYIRKYAIQPPAGLIPKIQGVAAKGWSGIAKETVVPDEAMDLLKRMVVIDHETRITAEEALRHPYLNGVREMVEVPGAAPEV
jgi:casein kinase II subunit alpha